MKIEGRAFGRERKDKLKQAALASFRQHPNKVFNHKQLANNIRQRDEYFADLFFYDSITIEELRTELIQVLEVLCKEESIQEPERGKYRLIPESKYIEGEIEFNSTGAAFVMNEEHEKDIYIAPRNTLNALNGDTVKVLLYAHREGKRAEGEVIQIVKRFKSEFTGRVELSDRYAFLIADSSRMPVDIFIPGHSLNGATDGDKVVVRISEWHENAKNPVGEVVKVLGKPGENNAEMDAILIEYGFPLSFPDDVERIADAITFEIPRDEIKNRKDYRGITTFTIDPADAKDFDDALSFRQLDNGNFEIGVHIADVSHYMPSGSALDREALKRATSVYLVDRVIPMLPEKLSNGVCSLRPNEEKLCFAAVFEINAHAEVADQWFGRTVIKSCRRFTYEEAQLVIETGKGDLCHEILTLDKLAKKLRRKRMTNGAINFDKVEVKFKLDEQANPVGVFLKESKDSNKLIEEFMLLANKLVAEFVGKHHASYTNLKSTNNQRKSPVHNVKTFVYRIHDLPDMDKVKQFAQFAARFGYRINMSNEKLLAHSINKLVEDVKGKGEQNLLEQLAIRSMAKAKYSSQNLGHYGLAFEYYTHFTSPIRRYPDVMVHRLLAAYLKNEKSADARTYEQWCKHSSEKEARAAEAERASVKYKQVQYIQKQTDRVFDGIISGVIERGLFVELVESKCEGMIRIRDLTDDYYEFDEKNICLTGIHTRKKYALGDQVAVVLKNTDLMKRQIDFLIYDEFPSSPKKMGNKFKARSKKR